MKVILTWLSCCLFLWAFAARTEPSEATKSAAMGAVVRGVAKWYDQYPMERVMRNRGMTRPPGYAGLASTPYCHLIGSTVWVSLYNPVQKVWGPWQRYYQVDCSRPGRDQRRHLCIGQGKGCVPLVVEVDAATAKRFQFTRAGKTSARVMYTEGHYIDGD